MFVLPFIFVSVLCHVHGNPYGKRDQFMREEIDSAIEGMSECMEYNLHPIMSRMNVLDRMQMKAVGLSGLVNYVQALAEMARKNEGYGYDKDNNFDIETFRKEYNNDDEEDEDSSEEDEYEEDDWDEERLDKVIPKQDSNNCDDCEVTTPKPTVIKTVTAQNDDFHNRPVNDTVQSKDTDIHNNYEPESPPNEKKEADDSIAYQNSTETNKNTTMSSANDEITDKNSSKSETSHEE